MIVQLPFGAADDVAASYPDLTEGSTGPFVTELQTRLNAAGANIGGNPNGLYDAGTVQAVKNFQAAYGMDQTGDATAAVWSKLTEVTPTVAGAAARASTTGPVAYIPPSAKSGKILGLPIPVAIAGGATVAFIAALALSKMTSKRAVPAVAVSGYGRRRHRR